MTRGHAVPRWSPPRYVGPRVACPSPQTRALPPLDCLTHSTRKRAGSVLCFLTTLAVIPNASTYLLRRGLKGVDLGKRGTPLGEREMCVRTRAAECGGRGPA